MRFENFSSSAVGSRSLPMALAKRTGTSVRTVLHAPEAHRAEGLND